MEDNKYEIEVKVVKIVLNWYKVNDGRGLGKGSLLF